MANAASPEWPKIQPFEKAYTFNSEEEMYLHFDVPDVNGKTAYFVECASPSNTHAKVENFAYSRQFECRLSLLRAKSLPESQLLVDRVDADREWMSRGGFTWNQITGRCSEYPDYGSQRAFRLRNLKLVITISGVRLGSPSRNEDLGYKHSIQGLTVHLTGSYDPQATGAVAGPSRFEEPKSINTGDPGGLLSCEKPLLRTHN